MAKNSKRNRQRPAWHRTAALAGMGTVGLAVAYQSAVSASSQTAVHVALGLAAALLAVLWLARKAASARQPEPEAIASALVVGIMANNRASDKDRLRALDSFLAMRKYTEIEIPAAQASARKAAGEPETASMPVERPVPSSGSESARKRPTAPASDYDRAIERQRKAESIKAARKRQRTLPERPALPSGMALRPDEI